jgi:hypothetical protein
MLVVLDSLVEPESRGDPMSPLRWTVKSTRALAGELTRAGHRCGSGLVGRMLRYMGYSLQANAKVTEGAQHRDRDAQFRYINQTAGEHLEAGQPVISVDCKKKELVGDYANGGVEWEPEGQPTRVGTHDFPDPEVGKAIPYGVYDVGANEGWVNVGDDHDTPAFAVVSIARWWERMGRARYPDATHLLITADAGGSNSYRSRAWKAEFAKLAATIGLVITVCHMPPGTLEVEQDRAPPVLVHLDELASQAPHHLPHRCRAHRRHHNPHRAHRPIRPRHQPLPNRPENHPRRTRCRPRHPPHLAPRLELQHQPQPPITAQVI